MMEQEWAGILARYGQSVTLRRGEEAASLQAFVQPVLDRGKLQEAPSPLGLERQDRFLYLGPAEYPLDLDTLVEWNGQDYRVRSAHLVGTGVCPYWWAALSPREEAAP